MLENADGIVLAARPRLADLHALAVWGETGSLERVSLVTIGDGPYPDAEISSALGIEVSGRLPWDPEGADALMGVPATDRRLRLAPLIRSARSLADQLAGTAAIDSSAVERPSEDSLSGRSRQLRSLPARVLRSRRVLPDGASTNGSAPEEATR
jgi:hypothetical protein